jgi:2-deoxy-D-gluconate 3-dehydrogenase
VYLCEKIRITGGAKMSNLSMFDLTGKKAVVTGACSGLGRGMATGLLEAGAEVAVIDFNKDVDQIAKEFGAIGFFGDVTDFEGIDKVFDAAVMSLGGLDILINSAGCTSRDDSMTMSMNRWVKLMSLNVDSVMHMCQLAAKVMVPQKSGKILNMASMTSFFGVAYAAAYAASKGAVAQLTKSLAIEWAPYGVHVNALAPGYMDTPLCEGITKNEDQSRYKFLLSRMPIGRWGRPEDLKGATVFLCSRASDYVTGILLPVDGGYLAK